MNVVGIICLGWLDLSLGEFALKVLDLFLDVAAEVLPTLAQRFG